MKTDKLGEGQREFTQTGFLPSSRVVTRRVTISRITKIRIVIFGSDHQKNES